MLSQSDRARLETLLADYGCNRREAAIYLESLQLGPASIQHLARQLGFNRITVHSAVQQLLTKGLLTESRKDKRRIVVAEPPSVFTRILQQRENELQVLKGRIGELESVLSGVESAASGLPTVRFLEEVDGFKRMLEDTLTARNELRVFSYVDLFSKLVGVDYLEDYFVRRAAKNIHTRLIFPPCSFADRVNRKAKQYKIKIGLLPAELKWQAGIFSWNNSLALLSFSHGKITCTMIENDDLAYFYREIIFELAWKQATPLKVK